MAKVRKDNKGRNLRPGETQRADGSYMYVYKLGTKKKYLYDSDLASLRVKEKQINKDKDDGIRTQEAMKLTLNDIHYTTFSALCFLKFQLNPFAQYCKRRFPNARLAVFNRCGVFMCSISFYNLPHLFSFLLSL